MKHKLIDFHVHSFPDTIAERTMLKLRTIAGIQPFTDGTVNDTRKTMAQWGVSRYVLQNIATRPGQEHTINHTAAQLQQEGEIAFGSVHPDSPDAIMHLEEAAQLGLKGIKLHPDYQNFFIEDPRMDRIYDAISQLGLIAFFHTGYDPLSPNLIHAEPDGIADVNHRFPRLRMVAAHLGGIADRPEQASQLLGRDIYLDISIAPARLAPEDYLRLILTHGAERMLLASDCPWGSIPDSLAHLDALDLTSDQRSRICYDNAAELLELSHD